MRRLFETTTVMALTLVLAGTASAQAVKIDDGIGDYRQTSSPSSV